MKPRFFELCLAEPFRIFFPLATFLGASGVSLWPLYFLGVHKFYPGPMHARMMIEGFLAGFVIGFLGTALPRLLSAPPLRRWELRTLLALYLLTAGLHIGEQPRAGDAAFIALMLCFGACMIACMIARVRRRAELPPPGFVLMVFGYLSGVAGPALWLCGMQGWVSGNAALFGAMLLNQAFVLFLLLGIGAFLLPRFLRPRAEERTASPGWRHRAAFSGLIGLILLASYWLEACNPAAPAAAAWLRGLAAIVYLVTTVPFHRQTWPPHTAAVVAQLALLALIAGLVFPLFWPAQRVAGLHVVFLGGFSLITFTVATRVVLGHSGNEDLFESRLPSLQVVAVLLLTGAVLRAVGDFSPARSHLLSAASYLWLLTAGVWGFSILPKVRLTGPSDAES